MSTTTTNVNHMQTISLPPINKLISAPRSASSTSTSTAHPPIYLKLNAAILDLLAQSPQPPKITLSITDRQASIRIDDSEFQGSRYKEPGNVEVYLPQSKAYPNDEGEHDEGSTFKSYGLIGSRILVKSDKGTKLATEPEQQEALQHIQQTQPQQQTSGQAQTAQQKITQLLGAKPISFKELVAKTQVPVNVVKSVLSRVAETVNNDSYILKKDVKEPSPPQKTSWQNSAENEPKRMEARPQREPKPKEMGKTAKVENIKSDNAKAESTKASSVKVENTKIEKAENTKAENTKAEAKAESTKPESGGMKRRALQSMERIKKAKPNEDETDMFELARKFQSAYGEYLELYSVLSNRKSRPPSQVQKLMAMHNQLASWKKTLWLNARSKSQVK